MLLLRQGMFRRSNGLPAGWRAVGVPDTGGPAAAAIVTAPGAPASPAAPGWLHPTENARLKRDRHRAHRCGYWWLPGDVNFGGLAPAGTGQSQAESAADSVRQQP